MILFISSIIGLIFVTFLHYGDKNKSNSTDECGNILNRLAEKHKFMFALIHIAILSAAIVFAQKMTEDYQYRTLSAVKKADVINSEYFKNLDEHKKELMKLYLLCDNKLNAPLSPKIDCSDLNIDLKNFSLYIPTHKLIAIIEYFEIDNFNESKNDKKVASDNFEKQKELVEYIKNAK